METTTAYAHFNGHLTRGPFLTIAVPARRKPLWWQERGLSFTASGYGRRIPSSLQVKINGRWRRVYVCCFSNAGTAYVEDRSERKANGRYAWITITE